VKSASSPMSEKLNRQPINSTTVSSSLILKYNFKVHFTEALDLVRSRKVYLEKVR
jgi:hypothetical protein